jgi:hypothetical protein
MRKYNGAIIGGVYKKFPATWRMMPHETLYRMCRSDDEL